MFDRGSGPPLIVLPGIQGRWEWLTPALEALSRRCRVVSFSFCDEPSSGFGFAPDRYIDNYFDQIDEVFARTGLSEAVLVGVSFSGPIAAEYAARHPHRVRALVLASALPPGWRLNRRARFYMRAPLLLSPVFLVDSPLRMLPELRASFPTIGGLARFSYEQTRRVLGALHSPSRMVARLRATAAYRYGDPRAIAQPVLVITGEDDLDRVVKPAWTREYLEAVRDARYEVLPRTGHIGMLTRPAEFADLVTRFMDQIGGDARRIPA